jgi:hypothetical protein
VWVEKALSDALVLAGGLLLLTWLVSEVRQRYAHVKDGPEVHREEMRYDPEAASRS